MIRTNDLGFFSPAAATASARLNAAKPTASSGPGFFDQVGSFLTSAAGAVTDVFKAKAAANAPPVTVAVTPAPNKTTRNVIIAVGVVAAVGIIAYAASRRRRR